MQKFTGVRCLECLIFRDVLELVEFRFNNGAFAIPLLVRQPHQASSMLRLGLAYNSMPQVCSKCAAIAQTTLATRSPGQQRLCQTPL